MQNQEFKLKPSKIYTLIVALLFFTSFVLVACVSMPFLLKLLLMLAIVWSGYNILRRYALLKSKNAIISLQRLADGTWRVLTSEKEYAVELCGESTITSIVSVLRFKIQSRWKVLSCVVLPDSLPPDLYRRMVVAIRE